MDRLSRLAACVLALLAAGPAAADPDPGGPLGSWDGGKRRIVFHAAVFGGIAGAPLGALEDNLRDIHSSLVDSAKESGGDGSWSVDKPLFSAFGGEFGVGSRGHAVSFVVRAVVLPEAEVEASSDWHYSVVTAHSETRARISMWSWMAGPAIDVPVGPVVLRASVLGGLATLSGTWREAGKSRVDLSPFGIYESDWEAQAPVEGTGLAWTIELEAVYPLSPRFEVFAGGGWGGAVIDPVKVSEDTDTDKDGAVDTLAGTVVVRDSDGRSVPFNMAGLRIRVGALARF